MSWRSHRTARRIVSGLAFAAFIAPPFSGRASAGETPPARENHRLIEKMLGSPTSPAELRAGIEAALAIPEWRSQGPAKTTDTWTRIGGTITDPDVSVEHDKVGRVRCAAWAWHNGLGETTLWVGASSGGLWYLGRNPLIPSWRIWVPVSKTLPGSPSVGAFLVHNGDSDRILVGTGDWGRSGDSGTGLYRTTNGGETWARISFSPEPSHFFKIMTDPAVASGQKVLAATDKGVFISLDFGATWGRAYVGSATSGVTDIARATDSSEWILGVPGTGVAHCSVLSTSFSACANASGIPTSIGRVSVAVSPAAATTVFALITNGSYGLNGIYRSTDGASTFVNIDPRATSVLPDGDPMAWGQGEHTHAIAVDPADPNRLIVGMAAAQMTLNATAANPADICWRRNNGITGGGCDTTGLDAGHVDQTSMAFIPQSVASGNTEILITNDGGIYAYDWSANTEDDRYNDWGLNVSQTYNSTTFDLSLTNPNRLLAGLQDNGDIRIDRDSTTEPYRYLFGGDGGMVSIQPGNDSAFAMSSGLPYNRYLWHDDGPAEPSNANLPGSSAIAFNHILNLPIVLTASGRYLYWRWTWEAADIDWRIVNPNHPLPSGVSIQAVEPGSIDPLVIYITDWNSSSNGIALYVMEEGVTGTLGDMNWEDRTPSGPFVSDVPSGGWAFADRSSEHGQYVTFTTGGHRPSRAYLSTNRGGNWWDVTGNLETNLPNVDYWQLAVHPMDHRQLFLATEVGIFRSDDSGRHWYRFMSGLPDVVKVRAMQIRSSGPDDTELIIATWGNGFWHRSITYQDLIFADGFETGNTYFWD